MGKRTLINRNTGKEVECCPECKSEIEAWADLEQQENIIELSVKRKC